MNIRRTTFTFLLFIGYILQVYAIDFYASKIVFTKTMPNEWGTICLPFDIIIKGTEDFTLYKLNSFSENSVFFEAYPIGSTIYAGTPCLIHKEGDLNLRIEEEKQQINLQSFNNYSVNGWSVLGTFSGTIVENDNSYYMAKNKIWHKTVESDLTIRPFCAWFETDNNLQSSARSFSIGILSPSSSDIYTINKDDSEFQKTFCVIGYPTQSLRKGINIVLTEQGSKKIFIK